jgi:hypothetical protein
MAATLDDLLTVLTEIREEISDLSNAVTSQNKLLEAASDSKGGLGVGESRDEDKPTAKGAKSKTGSSSGGGTTSKAAEITAMSPVMRNVMSISSSFTSQATNPFTPTSAAALSTAINMTPNLTGAATEALTGSQLAGEAARQSGVAAMNLAGPRELQFVVDQTTKDLQSTLSSLADQGIEVSDDQAAELAGAFQGRAKRKARALKQAAGAIDATIGQEAGESAKGIDNKQASEMVRTLKAIEANTKATTGGGNAPDAEMRDS